MDKEERCPMCGSDRVIVVTNMTTKQESLFCLDCGEEWPRDEVRIKEGKDDR